jgi:flavin reductase (DIM6/NTAB) family NADH-FMN oxidoreductase RutF
MRTIAGVR